MNSARLIPFIIAVALVSPARGLAAEPAVGPPKESILIDYADVRREPNGKVVLRPYEYAYGDWDHHAIEIPDRGTLIQAPSGKGGIGENSPMARFRDCTALALYFTIGNANQAQAIAFFLEDADGTKQTWNIRLARRPAGQPMRLRLHFEKPDAQETPGKKPGLDLAHIAAWQIKGDWSDAKVEVLLMRLAGER